METTLRDCLLIKEVRFAADSVWRGRLIDFFQYLCQAVTKVDRCAMVASLLASDPERGQRLQRV